MIAAEADIPNISAPTSRVGVVEKARTFGFRYWPIVLVLGVFAATAFVIPTMNPVATTDDWGYSRSVEILLDEGHLTVFPVVAATAVFQIGWGTAFALIFGMSLGIMRVSTLVMVSLGAISLYALLRELGVRRGRAALGTATYLFNPLSFILSYTFMTDPFLTSLILGSTYFYVRGLRRDGVDYRFVIAGSMIAACAFLTRQQGVLIPAAIGMNLLVTRRLWFNRGSVRLTLAVAGIPALTLVGYYAWLHFYNDIPSVQQSFTREIRNAGLEGSWRLGRNLGFIVLMYLGFFALPLTVSALAGLIPRLRSFGRKGIAVVIPWLAIPWLAVLAVGLYLYTADGKHWPYVAQFVGSGGLGPADVIGSRPRVLDSQFFPWATMVVAVSAGLVALLVSRGVGFAPGRDRTGAGIVLAVTIWQAIGLLPPSFHYIRRGYSLDRYLLPMLPLIVVLLLWAMKDLRLFQPIGWTIVAAMLAFSVAGTRDYLTFLDTVWDIAGDAHSSGISTTSIDAGAAWDGYNLYTYGLDNNITRARTRGGPWWMTFYGLASDSTYIVASKPKDGYDIMWVRRYSSWLLGEETPVYLLKRGQ
jgi:4-amino-4-deoxy-L-arabinose transferase-like glycosyltransferase